MVTEIPLVTLTEKASAKVRELLAEQEAPDLALRVYVKSGGCSGFSYAMALDHPNEDDHVIEEGGVRVLLDPMSAPYLRGSQIDFKEALTGGGFAINNPNAARTCGCGHSFRTAADTGEAEPC